jgi:hypothetical protein
MSVPATVFELVRERAGYACEYCGVTEDDTRGLLTIDHYRPQSHSGEDDPANLVYSCFRCNVYKADYWPIEPNAIRIWNPREEPASEHLFELDDSRLLALTDVGQETVQRLRLNRMPLVQARMKQRRSQTRTLLIGRLAEITTHLAQAEADHARLAAEENALLQEQRRILEALQALEP